MNLLKNKANFLIYVSLFLIWALSFFVRCYRQDQLLGFYYDQGRDAKMAADIISGRNFPAIGPTTGIQGLFLGPFWFYLITPGYFFGNGDPAIAACFISFIESLTVIGLFFLLKKYWHLSAAYLAAIIWGFSRYLVSSSRWFSNPSPLPFLVVLIIYFLLELVEKRRFIYLAIITFLLGISLQLEAASAIFFFPVILIFGLINFSLIKKVPRKYWLYSLFSFGLLLLPQAAFEFKNKFLITRNFLGFLLGKVNSDSGRSWAIPTLSFVTKRINDYYEIFFSKLDTNTIWISQFFLFLLIFGLVVIFIRRQFKTNFFILTLLWLIVPLVLLLFFVGNYGSLYDYYLTGFFPAFVLLFAMAVTSLPILLTKIAPVLIVLFLFFQANFIHLYNYIIAGVDGPTHITLGNQKQTVEYICAQSSTPYNLDFYVPPITPHAYEYLFAWYTRRHLCQLPQEPRISNLFTPYEVDISGPKRLEAWLARQDGIGKLIREVKFGGIVVQQRLRK